MQAVERWDSDPGAAGGYCDVSRVSSLGKLARVKVVPGYLPRFGTYPLAQELIPSVRGPGYNARNLER